MATAAIVGGASMIGTHLLTLLQKERPGWKIRAIDNFTTGNADELHALADPHVTSIHEVDILEEDAVNDALQDCEYVFNMAGILSAQFDERLREGLEVNVIGALNVVEVAAKNGSRLIFSSSAGVYGLPEPGVISEATPFNHLRAAPTVAVYGATKILGEHICRLLAARHPNFSWVALRYTTVYGRRQHRRAVHSISIVDNLRRLGRGERPRFAGSPDEVHDYTSVIDLARANLLAAEVSHEFANRVYLIATGVSTSNRELAALLMKVTGSDCEPIWDISEDKYRIPQKGVRFDISAAGEYLRLEPKASLYEGLSDLYESLTEQRDSSVRARGGNR